MLGQLGSVTVLYVVIYSELTDYTGCISYTMVYYYIFGMLLIFNVCVKLLMTQALNDISVYVPISFKLELGESKN